MGTGGSFPRGKVQPGRDADHSSPSSAEVKNEQELYLLSPQAPPWHVAGQLYFTSIEVPNITHTYLHHLASHTCHSNSILKITENVPNIIFKPASFQQRSPIMRN
jgi:hypothetical protein